MVFPVVMYGCESWTAKKAEHRRIVAFELWCWRRLLRVPWTARSSNQSILMEISPGCSLEGLTLKLLYFSHLMRRVDSLEKTLMLGGTGGRRRRGQQRMRWLMVSPTRWTWVWVNSRSLWWTGTPGVLRFMGSQRVRHDWVNWTELNDLCGGDVVTKSCVTLWDPWSVASQVPLSMEFPRQKSWNGLPFPSPGALPDSGIKPVAPALQADSLPLSCQGSPSYNFNYHFKGQNSKYSHTESY